MQSINDLLLDVEDLTLGDVDTSGPTVSVAALAVSTWVAGVIGSGAGG
ncbi:MAG: hypothetical protein NZ518_07230 [Dehalococcoidia bacterium]|nr:hypothetical protein [Dehalococcoidia bacterium]